MITRLLVILFNRWNNFLFRFLKFASRNIRYPLKIIFKLLSSEKKSITNWPFTQNCKQSILANRALPEFSKIKPDSSREFSPTRKHITKSVCQFTEPISNLSRCSLKPIRSLDLDPPWNRSGKGSNESLKAIPWETSPIIINCRTEGDPSSPQWGGGRASSPHPRNDSRSSPLLADPTKYPLRSNYTEQLIKTFWPTASPSFLGREIESGRERQRRARRARKGKGGAGGAKKSLTQPDQARDLCLSACIWLRKRGNTERGRERGRERFDGVCR